MDELLSKQIPHSVTAEQSVLGAMLMDSRCIPNVVGSLTAEDFYVEINRTIYSTMYSMFNYSKIIDPVTVIEKLKVDGVYTDGMSEYIIKLMEITPTSANVMEYVSILKSKSLLRKLADAGAEINGMAISGEGEARDILDAAEQRIYSIRNERDTSGLEPVSSIMADVYRSLSVIYRQGGRLPGLPTGLYDLDDAIMGLNKSDLILVASRPGMGKTSIALNIAMNVAKSQKKAIVFFSLEMSKQQLCLKLLSAESNVDNRKLQFGNITSEEWVRISDAAMKIGDVDILIDDNPMLSVTDMNAECRRAGSLGLVVIDYLQLMTSGTGTTRFNENRTQVVSEISRMLKIMAKELDVPILCLSQLSRANETRADKRPMLSDLRESGSIEQDADIVLGLYRDDYYNKDTERPNVAECIILKNRRGRTGTIELKWMPEFTSYVSIEREYEG